MRPLQTAWVSGILAVACACAAEPSEDSISTAKREFERMKAAGQPGATQAEPALKPSTPTLPPDAASGPIAVRPGPAGKLPRKSENWLVDAMMGPAAGSAAESSVAESGEKPAGLQRERTLLETYLATKPATDSGATPGGTVAGAQGQGTAVEQRVPETVFNPLAGFLGQWMSSQDYALLGSSLQEASPDSAIAGGKPPVEIAKAPAGGVEMPEMGDMIESLGSEPPAFAPPTPAENPYLHAFNEAMPSPAPRSPVVAAPAQAYEPGPALTPAPPAPARQPSSQIPDFVKPQVDQKYFKQLKRF